jgi:hypothetical protein
MPRSCLAFSPGPAKVLWIRILGHRSRRNDVRLASRVMLGAWFLLYASAGFARHSSSGSHSSHSRSSHPGSHHSSSSHSRSSHSGSHRSYSSRSHSSRIGSPRSRSSNSVHVRRYSPKSGTHVSPHRSTPGTGRSSSHHSSTVHRYSHSIHVPRPSSRIHAPRRSTLHAPRSHGLTCRHDSHGRISRSEAAKRRFMRQSGYPHGRRGYIVDHIIPLACGGRDTPSNMQWQTAAEARAKDRYERRGCR